MISGSTQTRMPTMDSLYRRTRVVIIEDNYTVAESFWLLLELQGYEVRVAHTGPEGVGLAQEWPADVVLCDLGLPGLDGYRVARALRKHPATAQARMIAVTADASDAARQRSQEVGFEQHLAKPVDHGVLLELLAAR